MYDNEQVWKVFLADISANTCLKMNDFGRKFPKIGKCWGSDPLASGGWGLRAQTLV